MKNYAYLLMIAFLAISGSQTSPARQQERPIPMRDTVFIEEMT